MFKIFKPIQMINILKASNPKDKWTAQVKWKEKLLRTEPENPSTEKILEIEKQIYKVNK